MSVLFTRRGGASSTDRLLSDFGEGEVVLLNEGGTPVEFYIAKHNYESGLNGAGRTLLVRKDSHSAQVWKSGWQSLNTYAGSDIDNWLSGTYKGLLDADVQSAIGTTKFYYTPNSDNPTVTTLSRAVFLLSATELGVVDTNANTEGSVLPIVYWLNVDTDGQWTRSPSLKADTHRVLCTSIQPGTTLGNSVIEVSTINSSEAHKVRPAFTLSGEAIFDFETREFKKGA